MRWAVALVGVVAISACTTGPIQQRHATTLSTVQIGDTISDIQDKFPGVYPGGQQSTQSGTVIDAWVFEQTGYNIKVDKIETQSLHFYFVDGKLVQWGGPTDWREREPDILIENRNY